MPTVLTGGFCLFKICLLIFGCAGSSLRACGLSLVAVHGFLIVVASPVAEHGL